MSVGSTTANNSSYLDSTPIVETVTSDEESDDGMDEDKPDDESLWDEDAFMDGLYTQFTVGAIDFDDIMASATHAR